MTTTTKPAARDCLGSKKASFSVLPNDRCRYCGVLLKVTRGGKLPSHPEKGAPR